MAIAENYNPDVLTCLANLSSDEVFTPPDVANRVLDLLPKEIWRDPRATFLDPACKSGVFLREITRRLDEGLESALPDRQERINHILKNQVFGIAITELTALLSRRSLYCSKSANGKYSVCDSFGKNEQGNVSFENPEHTWEGSKCKYCGAPKAIFDREEGSETYVYGFLHTDDVKALSADLFGGIMNFDVIVSNPPYQMTGAAGGSSDSSIYHLFVQQAMKLNPRYLSMIIPSRWMAGGRGLDEFRAEVLNSGHLRFLTDFPDSGEAFPGVQIKGGICYFLWDRDTTGTCEVRRVSGGVEHVQSQRELGEFDVFIRDERALEILKKVHGKNERSVLELVSGDTPFGIATNFEEWDEERSDGRIPLHLITQGKRMVGYIDHGRIRKNADAISVWKVLVPKAYGAGESFPHQILGKELLTPPPSVCTQSYLTVSPFQSEGEARSFASYYRTRFFRFLVSLRKITQDALRSTYTWVPAQAWDRDWTDEALYVKYSITPDEISFIESVVRPMGTNGD